MQQISQLLALAATVSTASAGAIQGFNYGSLASSGSAMMQADFETSFKTAQNLVGTNGAFASGRLYTMIQGSTTSDVISAIPAALATNTTLLLGLWCSGDGFANEITALKAAIATYGPQGLADIVTGISVGSEDLYRNSALSMANDGGVGQSPATLVEYIKEVRSTIAGTVLSGASIGHVDTWDAWTNATSVDVISNVDWLGVDEYPYWQTTDGNDVSNGLALFNKAYDATVAVAGGKDVWVTETGWAVAGKSEGEATPGAANAKTYWDAVGCNTLFGKVNTYWYTLSETGASPDFSVSESTSSTTPLYDLSCADVTKNTTSSSSGTSTVSSGTSVATGSGSSGSSSGSGSNSTSASGSGSNATITTSAPKTASTTGSGASSSGTSASAGSSGAMTNAVSFGGLFAAAAFAILVL